MSHLYKTVLNQSFPIWKLDFVFLLINLLPKRNWPLQLYQISSITVWYLKVVFQELCLLKTSLLSLRQILVLQNALVFWICTWRCKMCLSLQVIYFRDAAWVVLAVCFALESAQNCRSSCILSSLKICFDGSRVKLNQIYLSFFNLR